jgi:uncharacterized alkaline shock family protein YloU
MIRLGAAQIADEAIVSIVRGAVSQVPGARLESPGRVSRVIPGRHGPVEWDIAGDSATFSIDVVAAHGMVLPVLGADVRAAVSGAVTQMTGLEVRAVDVTVVGVERDGGAAR